MAAVPHDPTIPADLGDGGWTAVQRRVAALAIFAVVLDGLDIKLLRVLTLALMKALAVDIEDGQNNSSRGSMSHSLYRLR